MADNTLLNSGTGGDTIATDDIGAVKFQRVKLVEGADGVNDGDISATNPLPVEQRSPAFNRVASGALGAANAAVTISAEGAGLVHWEIDTGTLVGTVVFEATLDDTNWFAINAITIAGAIVASVTAFAARGALDSAGYSQARLRVSAFTSGTSNARAEASAGSGLTRLTQALPAGANNIGDVDVLTLPTLPAGTNNIGDVDVLTLPALVAGTANIGDVDVLTLPALVTGSATIGAVTGPTADNAANPTLKLGVLPAVALAAAPTRTEGNVNPLRLNLAGDAAITLDGEAVVLGAGAATIGALTANQSVNVAQINGVAPLMGNGVSGTGAQRVTIASDSTGTIIATQATAASLNAQAQGNVAHDAVDAGNPVKIGGKASLNEPTAVADADRVDAWHDQLGRQVVLLGHANPEPPVTFAATTTADAAVIAAPGASLSLYICKGSVHNAGAIVTAALKDGATARWGPAELAADGGGSLFDFGARGWKLTPNTALNVALGAAGTVNVNVTEFYIAA